MKFIAKKDLLGNKLELQFKQVDISVFSSKLFTNCIWKISVYLSQPCKNIEYIKTFDPSRDK